MVDMSSTLIHHGHIRLIKKARKLGKVIIGLTSDNDLLKVKGYIPELSFIERKEVLLAIEDVSDVVETPWLIDENVISQNSIDILVHGDDNQNEISNCDVVIFPRTEGISSTELRSRVEKVQLQKKNNKLMLTPGPACLLFEQISALRPVFGRNDLQYQKIFRSVQQWIKSLAGQEELICFQGSATLAMEMALINFIGGRCICIDTGYYSQRMAKIVAKYVDSVEIVPYSEFESINGQYDWVLACYTETSVAFKCDISVLREISSKLNAKLFLDATGSIGLEQNHSFADLIIFSSCKGLFGLVGAAFIAYKKGLASLQVEKPFYLDIETHKNSQVTNSYHVICSLYGVIDIHSDLVKKVKRSKQIFIESYQSLFVDKNHHHQPLLCSAIEGAVSAKDNAVVLYEPRGKKALSVICHLGEVWREDVNFINRIDIKNEF